MKHQSAKPSHYNKEALTYDLFNEESSKVVNQTIESVLQSHEVKTVLDLTCGTGSQVFWLAKRGYTAVGLDINPKMLRIARHKAKEEKLKIQFLRGDMRTSQVGQFDALLTIFNAIGHLTQADFEIALRNIWGNLKEDGLYLFDINNLSYLLEGNRITELTIDWQEREGEATHRVIQYSTIDAAGILASYTTSLEWKGDRPLKVKRSAQTLQIYTARQLQELLARNGFEVIRQCGIDGAEFVETQTDRILTVAQKR